MLPLGRPSLLPGSSDSGSVNSRDGKEDKQNRQRDGEGARHMKKQVEGRISHKWVSEPKPAIRVKTVLIGCSQNLLSDLISVNYYSCTTQKSLLVDQNTLKKYI